MKMNLEYLDNTAYITRKNLSKLLRVSTQQVIAYEKKDNPLRRADIGEKAIHYELLYALKWNADEIDHSARPQGDNFTGVASSDAEEYKDGDKITTKNAKKAKELEEAKIKLREREKLDITIKEMKGEYIRAEDVDKNMTELAVILLSSWRNLLETLPPLLAKKTQDEVHTILDDEFKTEVSELNKKVNS